MRLLLLTLTLLLCQITFGQVCSGGVGDPIVNITFGSGSAVYGPPLAPGVTGLTYQKDSCPLQGSLPGTPGGYTIVHSPGNSCYGGDWVNFTGDHTGDPNGYFMLINASVDPDNFYKQQVDGLCSSTSYQFSAWVINMASHIGEIPPDITFSIERADGTVLQTFDTGPLPIQNPAHWNQYAFNFSTPPGISSVIISMYNNAPGGYGNDLGVDDITFRAAGPSLQIGITGHSGDTVTLCSDPSNTLGFTSTIGSCYPSTEYQWQESIDTGKSWANVPAAVNSTYSIFPTAPGKVLYRLTAAQTGNIGLNACQVVSAPDSIIVLPTVKPAVSIGLNSGYACVDSVAMFTASPVAGGSQPVYQWMVNGNPIFTGTGVPTFSDALSNGDQVNCWMVSNAVCASPSTAVSNTITLQLLPDVATSIRISPTATAICQGDSVTFSGSASNGGSAPSFQWLINGQPAGKDTPVFTTSSLREGDQVSLVMTSNLQCSMPATSNAIGMTVHDVPVVTLPPDTVIAAHSSILLSPSFSGQVNQYQWIPATGLSDPSIPDPTASPVITTIYQLTVSNGDCVASATEKVEVFYDLQMPNAFTPNGDGINDRYRVPPGIPATIIRLSVFNRSGALVFSTANSAEGWNGTFGGNPQPAGTYVWMLEYINPILKKTILKKGTLELIR